MSRSFTGWRLDPKTAAFAQLVRDSYMCSHAESVVEVDIHPPWNPEKNADVDDALPIPGDIGTYGIRPTSVIVLPTHVDSEVALSDDRIQLLFRQRKICGFRILTVISARDGESFVGLRMRAAEVIINALESREEPLPHLLPPRR